MELSGFIQKCPLLPLILPTWLQCDGLEHTQTERISPFYDEWLVEKLLLKGSELYELIDAYRHHQKAAKLKRSRPRNQSVMYRCSSGHHPK